MIEVIIYRLRNGGIKSWPWWEGEHLSVRQWDGSVIDGAELRRTTMLEF